MDEMNIMELVEKYVSLSVKKQKLHNDLEKAARNKLFSATKMCIAMFQNDLNDEEKYGDDLDIYEKEVDTLRNEVERISALYEEAKDDFLYYVCTATDEQLIEVNQIIERKIAAIKNQLQQIKANKESAFHSLNDAKEKNNFQDELKYSSIVSDCTTQQNYLVNLCNAYVQASDDVKSRQAFNTNNPHKR